MPASKNKSLLPRYTAYTVLPSIAHAAYISRPWRVAHSPSSIASAESKEFKYQ
jgi:hypothetical protein